MKIFKILRATVGIVVLVGFGYLAGLYQYRQISPTETPKAKTEDRRGSPNFEVVGNSPNFKMVPTIPKDDLPGDYLKAFLVAYGDFRKIPDIPEQEKDLDKYTIYLGISPDKKSYYVTFSPVYVEPKYGVIDVEKYRVVGYVIRIGDFTIKERI